MLSAPVGTLLALLDKHYPQATTSLDHRTPFQLLVATILSAQCTDKLVNQVTPGLFQTYPTMQAFADADLEELRQAINKITFYNNKATFIKNSSRILLEKFHGNVPQTLDELITLPGVARKTANVVLFSGFGITAGVVVDTHVKRVSFRLGLTKETDPVKVERDLMELLPKEHWGKFSHQIIDHGRVLCKAPTPRCGECFLQGICPRKGC
ncbi:MAG: endonuclease III [bacterium]